MATTATAPKKKTHPPRVQALIDKAAERLRKKAADPPNAEPRSGPRIAPYRRVENLHFHGSKHLPEGVLVGARRIIGFDHVRQVEVVMNEHHDLTGDEMAFLQTYADTGATMTQAERREEARKRLQREDEVKRLGRPMETATDEEQAAQLAAALVALKKKNPDLVAALTRGLAE